MSDSGATHRHLDDEQIDEAARAVLDGSSESADAQGCEKCEESIALHARCISLARLLARDTLPPLGTPAVDAVRAIRRQSYRKRVLGELSTILTTSPLRSKV